MRSLIHKVTICHYWYELHELLIKFLLKELKDAVAPASATSLRRICARPRRSSFSKASSNTSHTASSTWDALRSGKRLAMAYPLWTSLNHVNNLFTICRYFSPMQYEQTACRIYLQNLESSPWLNSPVCPSPHFQPQGASRMLRCAAQFCMNCAAGDFDGFQGTRTGSNHLNESSFHAREIGGYSLEFVWWLWDIRVSQFVLRD